MVRSDHRRQPLLGLYQAFRRRPCTHADTVWLLGQPPDCSWYVGHAYCDPELSDGVCGYRPDLGSFLSGPGDHLGGQRVAAQSVLVPSDL
jgi:hypothetical protein